MDVICCIKEPFLNVKQECGLLGTIKSMFVVPSILLCNYALYADPIITGLTMYLANVMNMKPSLHRMALHNNDLSSWKTSSFEITLRTTALILWSPT